MKEGGIDNPPANARRISSTWRKSSPDAACRLILVFIASSISLRLTLLATTASILATAHFLRVKQDIRSTSVSAVQFPSIVVISTLSGFVPSLRSFWPTGLRPHHGRISYK
jgi:hypothetical protein